MINKMDYFVVGYCTVYSTTVQYDYTVQLYSVVGELAMAHKQIHTQYTVQLYSMTVHYN